MKDILKNKEITVITRNGPHCYYQYREQPMGFEYDLASAFAKRLGVRLNIKTIENWSAMLLALKEGRGALIAPGLPAPPFVKKQTALSDNYLDIYYQIIFHRNNPGIKSLKDLDGKTIHVSQKAYHPGQFKTLEKQGIKLHISLHDDLTTGELIAQVAQKKIEIAVAAGNIAKLNQRYFPQIIVSYPVSERGNLCWVLSPKSDKLLEQVNSFLKKIREEEIFEEIYDKYYSDIDGFDYVDLRAFHRRINTRLPKYRNLFEKAAADAGFDWRLIAAQAYQESHFVAHAISPSGAAGIMQLTPNTAKSLGVRNIFNPEQNIKAGVKHLKRLYDLFDKTAEPSRIFLALAAYNVGQGHIQDARKLARKLDLNPDRWTSISKTLPLLSKPQYYKTATYGYCRGSESLAYIDRIMVYYDILKRQSQDYMIGLY